MKIRLKPMATALCLAGFIALPAVASTQMTLKHGAQADASTQSTSTHYRRSRSHHSRMNRQIAPHQVAVIASHERDDDQSWINVNGSFLPFDLDTPGVSFVTSGPYVGLPLQFAGSNLIINAPSVNTDVQLLNMRKAVTTRLTNEGLYNKNLHHSHLLLSGALEGQAIYMRPGAGQSSTNLALSNVALDAVFLGPSSWTLGMIELAYDDAPPIGTPGLTSQSTTSNSRVYVNKAFLTVGDFLQSPFYASFGQFYAPFGQYSSAMVTDPLTKNLARTKMRGVTVGYQGQTPNAFYAAAYLFRGDSHTTAVSRVNNGGVNLGYKFKTDNFGLNLGGGILANLADSVGMQKGVGLQTSMTTETILHTVPAYDVHANLDVGSNWDFIAEFISATKAFDPMSMGYKGRGAKPNAFDIQGAYSLELFNHKPSAIAVGYGHSQDALAMGLPLSRYSATFNTSLWRNTLQAIEFRREREYPASATAVGAGVASTPQSGRFDNVITAQFDYYF